MAVQGERGNARRTRGKMQPARSGQRQALHVTNHASQPVMAQPFFHQKQHGFFVTCFDVNNFFWMQASAGKPRHEQIARAQAPKHRTFHAREDTSGEHDGSGIVRVIRAARNFVQCRQWQTTMGQMRIHFWHAKRESCCTRTRASAFDPLHSFLQSSQIAMRLKY